MGMEALIKFGAGEAGTAAHRALHQEDRWSQGGKGAPTVPAVSGNPSLSTDHICTTRGELRNIIINEEQCGIVRCTEFCKLINSLGVDCFYILSKQKSDLQRNNSHHQGVGSKATFAYNWNWLVKVFTYPNLGEKTTSWLAGDCSRPFCSDRVFHQSSTSL